MSVVKHILADGAQKTDITGHVVKASDAPAVYELIHRMNKETQKGKSA